MSGASETGTGTGFQVAVFGVDYWSVSVSWAWSMTRKRRRKTGARRVLTMSDTYKADMISYRIEQNSSYEKNSAGVGFRR